VQNVLKLPVRGHRQFLLSLGLLRHGLIHCFNELQSNEKQNVPQILILCLGFNFLIFVCRTHSSFVVQCAADREVRQRSSTKPDSFQIVALQCLIVPSSFCCLFHQIKHQATRRCCCRCSVYYCNHQFKCLPVVHQTANDSLNCCTIIKNLFLFFFQTFCLKCDNDVKEMLSPTCKSNEYIHTKSLTIAAITIIFFDVFVYCGMLCSFSYKFSLMMRIKN